MAFSICGSTTNANTGAIQCDRRRGIPKKIIIGGKQFDSSDVATEAIFDAALRASFIKPNSDSSKLFPFPEITGTTDKSEAAKEGTLGAYGPKVTFVAGKPGYEFDVIAGTTLEKELKKFNGQQVSVFVVDDSSAVWGDYTSSKFQGTQCIIHTSDHKFGDGQNGQTTKVSVSAVSSDGFGAFMTTGVALTEMVGLLDAVVAESSKTGNAVKVTVKIATASPGTSINVYDSYADELADATKWVATVVATGVSHTITSVAKDTAISGWTVTLDSTQYTALSSGAKVSINLASPVVLDAADITGIEGSAATITKP